MRANTFYGDDILFVSGSLTRTGILGLADLDERRWGENGEGRPPMVWHRRESKHFYLGIFSADTISVFIPFAVVPAALAIAALTVWSIYIGMHECELISVSSGSLRIGFMMSSMVGGVCVLCGACAFKVFTSLGMWSTALFSILPLLSLASAIFPFEFAITASVGLSNAKDYVWAACPVAVVCSILAKQVLIVFQQSSSVKTAAPKLSKQALKLSKPAKQSSGVMTAATKLLVSMGTVSALTAMMSMSVPWLISFVSVIGVYFELGKFDLMFFLAAATVELFIGHFGFICIIGVVACISFGLSTAMKVVHRGMWKTAIFALCGSLLLYHTGAIDENGLMTAVATTAKNGWEVCPVAFCCLLCARQAMFMFVHRAIEVFD